MHFDLTHTILLKYISPRNPDSNCQSIIKKKLLSACLLLNRKLEKLIKLLENADFHLIQFKLFMQKKCKKACLQIAKPNKISSHLIYKKAHKRPRNI